MTRPFPFGLLFTLIGLVALVSTSNSKPAWHLPSRVNPSKAAPVSPRPIGVAGAGARFRLAASDSLIVAYDRIQAISGNYSYRALAQYVVIKDISTGEEITFPICPGKSVIGASFRANIEKNADLRNQLSNVLSDEYRVFNNKLVVQVFDGGTMVYEPSSNIVWWGTHIKRSSKGSIKYPAETAPFVTASENHGETIPTTPTNPNPAAQPEAAAAFTPGDVIASGQVGPAGGEVTAAGSVSVKFDQGSLARNETVVVRRAKADVPGGRFYSIERDGGHGLLAKPARVTFTMPAGVSAADVVPVSSIGDGAWIVVPSTVDKSRNTVTAEMTHFSGGGWFSKANCIRVVGAAIASAGTVIVITAVAATGVVASPFVIAGGAAAAILATSSAVGAAASNKTYDYWQRMGKDGVLMVAAEPKETDFCIRWTNSDFASDPMVTTVGLDENGQMLTCVGGRVTRDQMVAAMAPKNLKSQDIAFKIRSVDVIPRKIWILAFTLGEMKQYYRANKLNPPGAIEVLVDKELSRSKANEQHLGEWDDKFLRVGVSLVNKLAVDNGPMDPDERDELLATVGHEYWHAIYFANNYAGTSKFAWLNEAAATALESEIGHSYRKSFSMYQAALTGREFERGLLDISDPYCMWPVVKYALHKRAPGYVTEIATGKIDKYALGGYSGVFNDMANSFLMKECALPDPIATAAGPVPTGWSVYGLDDLVASQSTSASKGLIKYGPNSMAPAPPLSLTLRRFVISPPSAGQPLPVHAQLVVRREHPANAETVIVFKPEFGPDGKMRVGGRRATSDTRSGTGAVASPAEWIDNSNAVLPVAFVNKNTYSADSGQVWVYLLTPPNAVQVNTTADGQSFAIRWKAPDFGSPVKPESVLKGFCVVYKTKSGAEVALRDLMVKPTDLSANIPASRMPGQVAIGVASVDGALANDDGQPLMSAVAYPTSGQGTIKVTVKEDKPGNLSDLSPFEVLGGKPTPNAPVSMSYIDQGKLVSSNATTNASGQVVFKQVPLNIAVTITAPNGKQVVTCTASKPIATVAFGWQGHEVTPGDGGVSVPPP